MGLISIIIVTYNSEIEISDCISSIINTSKKIDFNILIADNNSNDNTVLNIEYFDSSKITLIKNDLNFGYTKANNQCLKIAKGNYILFLNPDTILQKGSLKTLIEALDNDDELGAGAPQLKYPNGTIQKSCRRFPRRRDVFYEVFGLSKIFKNSKEFNHWKMGDFNHTTSEYIEQPAGAAILVKRKVIDEIGLLDEQFPMFFSDVDFCKRIINNGHSIKFTTDTFITHKGGSSIFRNRTKMILTSHISFYKYFAKHKKGIINSILNIIIGCLLILMIPFRVFINLLLPSLKHRKKQSL